MKAFIGWWIGFIATAFFAAILELAFGFRVNDDLGAAVGVFIGIVAAVLSSKQGIKETFGQFFASLFVFSIICIIFHYMGEFSGGWFSTKENSQELTTILLQKSIFFLLSVLMAYILSYVKKVFAKFMDKALVERIFLGSIIALVGYFVTYKEGLSFPSILYSIMIGFFAYFIVFLIETSTESDPEPKPTSASIPEPEPIPTPEPIIEDPKDFYVTCKNCGKIHKNPIDALCSNCGKNMYKLDTNIKCNNCSNEYENTETFCPYCGNSN